MNSQELHHCDVCHSTSTKYWHGITPGLVNGLIKLKRAVIAKGENSIHTRRDLDRTANELSKGEYANWTILRFHGLIAKDDAAGAGHWLLTSRGNAFLKDELAIPKKVQTLNNHVVGHSDVVVTVEEVMGSRPYFETIDDKERESLPLGGGQLGLAL